MGRTKAKFLGLAALKNRLKRAQATFEKESVKAVQVTCEDAQKRLKDLTPRDDTTHMTDRNEGGPHTNELWMPPKITRFADEIFGVVDHPYNEPGAIFQRSAPNKPRIANSGTGWNLLLGLELGVDPHPIPSDQNNIDMRFWSNKNQQWVRLNRVVMGGGVQPAGMMNQTRKELRPVFLERMQKLLRKVWPS